MLNRVPKLSRILWTAETQSLDARGNSQPRIMHALDTGELSRFPARDQEQQPPKWSSAQRPPHHHSAVVGREAQNGLFQEASDFGDGRALLWVVSQIENNASPAYWQRY
jgi:hypothetical protein